MKLFSKEQIYEADRITEKKQEIQSAELMERAAVQIFNWMHLRMQGAPVKIHLFCGIGNNGGDGIALARHLQEHGYHIAVYVVNYSKTRSKDFLVNLERLKSRKVWPEFLDSDASFPEIGKDDIIVDAIFGIGLNRAPAKWVVRLMGHLHASEAFILSVDLPSGLFTDRTVENDAAVIRSNYVLSFQAPKLVFFLPETGGYLEQWEVLDIGLDPEYLAETDTAFRIIGKNEVLPMYIPRKKYSHKGSYGHALIIGGSIGKIGAVHLAAKSCLRVGSGLVTALVPECGALPLQTNLPEAMVATANGTTHINDFTAPITANAFAIGMGLGTEAKTKKAFSDFLKKTDAPLVLDADALNLLAQNKDLQKQLPKRTVLTPHEKELERLIGSWENDFEKLEKAMAFAARLDCILVIKGAHTITIDGDKGYVNTTGNPGMATAGSGDVLAGMIAGLMAQGYAPLNATIFGVYLHGRAGDIAIEDKGYQALIASDITDAIGAAYMDLFKVPEPPKEAETNEA